MGVDRQNGQWGVSACGAEGASVSSGERTIRVNPLLPWQRMMVSALPAGMRCTSGDSMEDSKAASSHAYGVPAHSTEALLESFTGATTAHAAPYPRQKTQSFGRKPTKSDHLSDDEPIDRPTQ